MNIDLFTEYNQAKTNYNNGVKTIIEQFNDTLISEQDKNKLINDNKNKFKNYLGSIFQKMNSYLFEKINYSINIYTIVKTHNAQMNLIETKAIMNNEEFNQECETLQYKIKNSNIEPKILDNLMIIFDYICTYHQLILENAPIRESIVQIKNDETIPKTEIKKPKIKVNFFIKFLPTIIAIVALIIIYLIYNG